MRLSTVLFLAANPLRTQRLQLDVECRAIEEKIWAARFREHIHFRSRWAVRPDDVLQALNEDSPSVLHFSGHGAGAQGICLQSEDGSIVHVTADGLAQIIRAAGASVTLVVLNACYSDVQAQALIAHVPCVVGIPGAIGDEAAIIYAGSFYRALAFGKPIANAHQQGMAALALNPNGKGLRDIQLAEARSGTLAPVLLTRSDIDANCVYVVKVASVQQPEAEGPALMQAGALSLRNTELNQRVNRSEASNADEQKARAVEIHHLEAHQGSTGVIVRMDGPGPQRRSTVKSTEGEPKFTGRDNELHAIEEVLLQGRVVVLYGASGLGKSRLAQEYAHRHVEAYPGGMVFVPFDQPPPMELARLLRELGKPVYPDESIEDQCRRALRELGGAGRTLLVYDAVADERTLRAWLPYDGLDWHLIVTSTSARWATSWSTIEVGGLDGHAARALVSAILADQAAAVQLAESIAASASGITIELCAIAAAARERLRRGRAVEDLAVELAKETTSSFEAAWTLLSRNAQLGLRVASAFARLSIPTPFLVSTLQRLGLSRSAAEAALDEASDRNFAEIDSGCTAVNSLVARFVRDREPLEEGEIPKALLQRLMEAAGSVFEAPGASLPYQLQASPRGMDAVEVQHPPAVSGSLAEVPLDVPLAEPSAEPPIAFAALSGTGKGKPKRKYRAAARSGGALASLAAAIAIYLLYGSVSPNADAFAELKTRPYDIRLAYVAAAGYRPPREHMRGGTAPAGESIPYAALDAFQKHRDGYALAIARAFNGDKPAEVAAQLRALPQTPSIRSDRTAIELLTTSNDNAEPLLAELEALRTTGDPAVARAARWNYAIQLVRLDLPLSAAAAFQDIARDGEPGWADEALRRAAPEDQRAKDFQIRFDRARKAGNALVSAGTPVPSELVKVYPGLLRGSLYDAVRTAPSRERVLALTAMAAELDRVDGPEESHILSDYVARVGKLDFQRRAPLAAAYARLLQGGKPTAGEERALLAASPSGDVLDIVMGAMAKLEVVPAHLDAFRQMVKQAGDPWFEIALARAEATADAQHSNWVGAEARLRSAGSLCSRAGAYQRLSTECLGLELQLGTLYENLHRIPEALKVLQAAVRSARTMGDWSQYSLLLWRLADTERLNSSTATARAYASELLGLVNNDYFKLWGHWLLAGAAVLDVDGRAARRDFEEAIRYRVPALDAANLLSDIARLDPQPGDLAQLQTWLRDIRGSANAAERVLADEIEGGVLIERDRPAGRALLERAIAAADVLPHEVMADKARANAYSVLAFDAARHGDADRVLTLVAEDLGRSSPTACAVGMVAQDERAVVVVRGADGRDRAVYDEKRTRHSTPLNVPGELAQGLTACTHVQVMALAALQGQPHVLPANLPWSYAASARGRASPGNPPTEPRTLIVTDVTPPAYLQLPPLQGRPQPLDPAATLLSGPAATPTRVLVEMPAASEIQFHTHALMDVGVSDASHLVLSPDTGGNYALTAESIRSGELHGHPIVVLAACHSAQGARYQHASWSLPDAFLAVGAHAVFAAAADVPDLEAGPFFTRVLARVREGADPAVALRDERMVVLTSNPSSWVSDVILFE